MSRKNDKEQQACDVRTRGLDLWISLALAGTLLRDVVGQGMQLPQS